MSPDRLLSAVSTDLDDAARLRYVRELVVAIAENTEAVVFSKDREGRYIFVNQHCVDLWAMPREEILGKTDFDLFPPDVARRLRAHDQEVLERGEPL